MESIIATKMTGPGARPIFILELEKGDATFTFLQNTNPLLIINNMSDEIRDINISGKNAKSKVVSGIGDVDLSRGYNAGEILPHGSVAIPLNSICAYFDGKISLTSNGQGVTASLLEMS